MADEETVTLLSSEHEEFKVPKPVAEESETIRNMLAETSDDSVVPVMNVTANVLSKVIEYCKFSVESKPKDGKPGKSHDEIEAFKKAYLNVDKNMLFELILAANFLNISNLLDVTCQAVADLIKNKTPEQIRQLFGIENDFTPEEEEQIRKENQWAYD